MSSKPHFIVNLPSTLLEWCKVAGAIGVLVTPIVGTTWLAWKDLNEKVSGYTTYVAVNTERFKSIDERLERLEDAADNAHGAKTAAMRTEAPQ